MFKLLGLHPERQLCCDWEEGGEGMQHMDIV